MNPIEKLRGEISAEFQEFEEKFDSVFVTDNQILQSVYKQILSQKGKQLRPILLLFLAKKLGTPTANTIYSAILLELVHTASLIHDDVVDNALERRGKPSVNAVFGNQVAVLSGDYILSKTMGICFEKLTDAGRIQKIIYTLLEQLSEGELLQLHYANNLERDEEKYFSIISKKTAALFSACSQVAALSVGASAETVEKMRKFGENFGICYQIMDDIFDYSPSLKTGKSAYNDIKEGKNTLPLIFALEKAENSEREKVLEFIKAKNFTAENLDFLQKFVEKNGGIEFAKNKILEFSNEAKRNLEGVFSSAEVEEILLGFVDFLSKREF